MAFPTSPTPAFAQAPPPPPSRTSSGRGPLLAIAGVLAVASVGAIWFAMRGSHGGQAVVFDSTPSAAPATSLAAVTTGDVAPAAPSGSGSGDIPPLSGAAAGAKTPHAGDHAAPSHSGTAGSAHPEHGEGPAPAPTGAPTVPPFATALPTSIPTTLPTTLPTSLPTAQPTSTAAASAASAKYDGIECQRARAFRALNRPREAQSWALACIAKGGAP
jgi:hypothetical protein